MTGNAQDLATQTFQAALGDGPSEQPRPVQQFIAHVATTVGQPPSLDTESLGFELYAEFPFLSPLVSADMAPDRA
jgi:hypothetical protein